MKDLGEAQKCVGLKIERDSSGNYYLDQTTFIQSILERFDMTNCNPVSTSGDPNQKLSKQMCPATEIDRKEVENYPYQQLVGALLYLVQGSRPDISLGPLDGSETYSSIFKGNDEGEIEIQQRMQVEHSRFY